MQQWTQPSGFVSVWNFKVVPMTDLIFILKRYSPQFVKLQRQKEIQLATWCACEATAKDLVLVTRKSQKWKDWRYVQTVHNQPLCFLYSIFWINFCHRANADLSGALFALCRLWNYLYVHSHTFWQFNLFSLQACEKKKGKSLIEFGLCIFLVSGEGPDLWKESREGSEGAEISVTFVWSERPQCTTVLTLSNSTDTNTNATLWLKHKPSAETWMTVWALPSRFLLRRINTPTSSTSGWL